MRRGIGRCLRKSAWVLALVGSGPHRIRPLPPRALHAAHDRTRGDSMKRLAVIAVLAAFFHPAHAQVSVTDAWVRATAPQQKVAGAYMTLRAERDLRLVEVRSLLAGSAEVHETSHVDNMMRMRPVK